MQRSRPRRTFSAFAVAAPAARIVLVGMGQPTLELPVATIQQRELLVTGTFRYANTYPAAIALAASGVVDLDGLVTAKFGLEQVAEALTIAKTDPSHPQAGGLPGAWTGYSRRPSLRHPEPQHTGAHRRRWWLVAGLVDHEVRRPLQVGPQLGPLVLGQVQ